MSLSLSQSIYQDQIKQPLPAADTKPESTITGSTVIEFAIDDILDHINRLQNYVRFQQQLHISTQRYAVCYHRAQIN